MDIPEDSGALGGVYSQGQVVSQGCTRQRYPGAFQALALPPAELQHLLLSAHSCPP